MKNFFPFALLFGLILQGCRSAPKTGALKSSDASSSEQLAIQSALQQINTSSGDDYRISPTDLVKMDVFQHDQLSRELRVSQEGTISVALAGVVKIGGLTIRQAEELVSDKLKEFLVNPQVHLFIEKYASKRIYVLGEVAAPGSIDMPDESPLSLLEAITMAGGFTPIAAPDRTRVMRNVGGKSQVIPIVVSDITKRGKKEADVILKPNDIIYVPQSFF